VPIVVENVCGAQKWVGRAKWHYGSFYLWGDVPAIMPSVLHRKVPGFNFHEHEKTGKGRSMQSVSVKNTKSTSRAQASAEIAKIPPELARYIAATFKPSCANAQTMVL
jgi:hypothetical protein